MQASNLALHFNRPAYQLFFRQVTRSILNSFPYAGLVLKISSISVFSSTKV